jgi:ribosomal protein L37E
MILNHSRPAGMFERQDAETQWRLFVRPSSHLMSAKPEVSATRQGKIAWHVGTGHSAVCGGLKTTKKRSEVW